MSTLLPRDVLPQIPHDKLTEFIEFVKGHDIEVTEKDVPVSILKPIQKHVNADKVEKFKKDISAIKENPLIISKSGYILDGHHRWIAVKETDSSAKMKCIICGCKIRELIELGHLFDGSFVKSVDESYYI